MTEAKSQGSALDFGANVDELTDSVASLLVSKLDLTRPIASLRAKRLMKLIGVHSGVFRTTVHQCEWLHPTFREFLAAEAIVDEAKDDEIEKILTRFRDVTWRQVILFIVELLSERGSAESSLRKLKDLEPPYGLALVGLAISEGANVDEGFIEEVTRRYETEIGPMNGAKVVARAWTDPAYRQRLLADGTAAIAELGISGPEGAHIVVVENTPEVHNVIVCTLCSCYPWPVLGAPPNWYKDAAYRSRVVREPRVVLREMGCAVPDAVGIRVWDSSAEVRYLVVPERPAGTEDLSEEKLAGLVTRDAMIGVARL
jgi:nitrile hydratase